MCRAAACRVGPRAEEWHMPEDPAHPSWVPARSRGAMHPIAQEADAHKAPDGPMADRMVAEVGNQPTTSMRELHGGCARGARATNTKPPSSPLSWIRLPRAIEIMNQGRIRERRAMVSSLCQDPCCAAGPKRLHYISPKPPRTSGAGQGRHRRGLRVLQTDIFGSSVTAKGVSTPVAPCDGRRVRIANYSGWRSGLTLRSEEHTSE